MRKYLMPSVLILLGFAGYGVAQTINRAIQLSQDTTGAFSVDSNNGVYFPGHVISSTSINARPAPTVTGGNGTPTVSGTDFSGTITAGGGATLATLTFGTAFLSPPNCVVSTQSALVTTNYSYTVATTSIRWLQPATSANLINYVCPSAG